MRILLTMRRRLSRPATRVTALLALAGMAGCAAAPAPEPGATVAATGDTAHAHHVTAPAPAPSGTAADVQFLRHMIPHHAQALVMTAMVSSRTGRPDIRMVAERITVSQQDEIALMQRWLQSHGEPAAPLDTAHALHTPSPHTGMPGILTVEQLNRLAAARGPEFDRLFLELMIAHHRGALTMVSELLARGGAQRSEMYTLASEIESDQMMEIQRMERLLAGMPSASPDR